MSFYTPSTSFSFCKNEFCMTASALVSSMLFIALFSNKKLKTEFENTLDANQKEVYSDLKRERTFIFIIATIVSIIAGYIAYNMSRNVCYSMSVLMVFMIMIYKLWPKSDYIMNHIYSNEQSGAWMRINTNMTRMSDIGLLVGIGVFMVAKYLL